MSDSRKNKDWLGREYVEHQDDSGNVTGTSRKYTDSFGRDYLEHSDDSGNVIGTSHKYTDSFGREYTEHRNADGETTGSSRKYKDWLGQEYIEHQSDSGSVIGTSRDYEDRSGRTYTEHRGGKKSSSIGGYSGGGGVAIGGFPIGLVLVVSVIICILSRNDTIIVMNTRQFIGICLCPIALALLLWTLRGRRTADTAEKRLRKKLLFVSSLLFLTLQLIFLLYTDPVNEGGPVLAFMLFVLSWIPKLIYSIFAGNLTKAACREGGYFGCVEMSRELHEKVSIGYGVVAGVMEFLNAITMDTFKSIIGAVIYGVPSLLLLVGVISLLIKLTGIPYRRKTKAL